MENYTILVDRANFETLEKEIIGLVIPPVSIS